MSALEVLNKRYIPLDGLAKQKAYMRYQLRLGNLGIKAFVARLLELNNYLAYFPAGDRSSMLPDDELIEIIDRAKPIEWHLAMLTANIDPSSMSLQEVVEYFERLEIMEKIRKQAGLGTPSTSVPSNSKRNKKRDPKVAFQDSDKKHCLVCDTDTHNTADCFVLKKAKKLRGNKPSAPAKPSYEKLQEELNLLKAQVAKKKGKTPKRRLALQMMSHLETNLSMSWNKR